MTSPKEKELASVLRNSSQEYILLAFDGKRSELRFFLSTGLTKAGSPFQGELVQHFKSRKLALGIAFLLAFLVCGSGEIGRLMQPSPLAKTRVRKAAPGFHQMAA